MHLVSMYNKSTTSNDNYVQGVLLRQIFRARNVQDPVLSTSALSCKLCLPVMDISSSSPPSLTIQI